MSEPSSPEEVVHRLRDQLDRLRQDASAGSADRIGVGSALDDKVRITVSAGRVSEVNLDTDVWRMPTERLAEAIRDATNAAIAHYNEEFATGLPATPPTDELVRTLDEISADSMRAMEESARGIRDAISAVQRVSTLHRTRSGN